MTNTELLNQKINDSGLKKSKICEALGVSYPTLRRKVNGEVSFTQSEIQALCDVLNIVSLEDRNAIFFN